MAARTKRPRSITSLRKQLVKPMPDPKGDRLRSKIANCGFEEHCLWQRMTPEMRAWIEKNVNTPKIAESVIKVTNWDDVRTLLVYYEPLGNSPTLFMIVPSPIGVL